jgi:RsiW-degrading membrane proteinase PrsW (M82 family)
MLTDQLLRLALGLLPVILFLAALRLMDSYKLVPRRKVLGALLAGGLAALLCYQFNTFIFQRAAEGQDRYASFGAPVVEELVKAAYWIFLIATARVAFLVDSAICGFAVGAGFALIENVFYLHVLEGRSVGVWFLRGFGTAMMHGGVAALGAIISSYLSESRQWRGVRRFAPGVLAAIALHSLFNQGILPPAALTAVTFAGLPVILGLVFYFSERSLRSWLGGKLDRDIDMLNMIARGEFDQTRSGAYLMSLRDTFAPEVRGDMLCLIQLTIELSVRAKADLLLREVGLEVAPDPELERQFKELKYLQKSIGPTGTLALRPLLSQTPRDLWEMHQLAQPRR